MKTLKIKMPSGRVADELIHFMGGDDDVAYNQKSDLGKSLIDKFMPAKTVELSKVELRQLIKEVENAADILQDHIGDGEWTGALQYHLNNFLVKLNQLNR